ncbi:MAG: ATP-binding protein, partial [Flavisolibacter sp.]
WTAHNISADAELQDTTIKINPELGDILLNNLLSNATRHNYPGGRISIVLMQKVLKVSNTSVQKGLLHDKLFQRFNSSGETGHNGLGLSIIKQICDASGFDVEYHFSNEIHTFEINFK